MVHEMKTKWMFQTAAIITARLLHPQQMSSSTTANTQKQTIARSSAIKMLLLTTSLPSKSVPWLEQVVWTWDRIFIIKSDV